MEIRITYVGTLNGIRGMWCGFKPEGAIITEERTVLYPSEGKVLRNLTSGEIDSTVWLKSESLQTDWEEIDEPKPEEPIND